MPELIAPTVALHRSWIESRDEWGRDVRQDGAGLRAVDDVDAPEGFAAWVDRLNAAEHTVVSEGWVRCTFRWIVEGAGGILEDIRDTEIGTLRRYRVTL